MPYNDDDYQLRLSNEIYNLRKVGRLDEARALAEQRIAEDEGDIDVWKAYAWTLIDIGKRHMSQGDLESAAKIAGFLSEKSQEFFQPEVDKDEFIATLVKKITEFSLTTNPQYVKIKKADELSKKGNVDEALEIIQPLAASGNLSEQFHESYGWLLYRYLRDRYQTMNSVQVRTMLKNYIYLKNPRPSLLHSQILSFAVNYSREDKDFRLPAFFLLWGPVNLRDDDYSDQQGNDGRIPSLVSRLSRVIIHYPQSEIKASVERLPRGKKDRFIELMRESYSYSIYFSLVDGKPTASTWNLFDAYLDFFPDEPGSENHSKILEWAERLMQENNAFRFYTFFKRWNPAKLMAADWREKKGQEEGVVFKPLAMNAIRRAKEALKSLSDEQIGDIQWLIDLYDIAAKKFPDDDWNIRSKGLLLLRAGHPEDARAIYKDLCLKMGEKSYIWQEFAECWDDNDKKIALLCKAISMERSEDFIGKTRLALARQLIVAGKKENAAIELARYKAHYQEKGWGVSQEEIESLLTNCGGAPTDKKASNDSLYAENIPIAEDCAFQDIPYTRMTLVDMWENGEGKELVCLADGENSIVFKKNRFSAMRECYIGQEWRIKLFKEEKWEEVEEWYPRHRTVKKLESVTYTPLTVTPSTVRDWYSLPLQYGFVQHVNEVKKVYHIFSAAGDLFYEHYEEQKLNKGDYVVFRQYKKNVKGKTEVFLCDIRKCKEEEAIEHFSAMSAVVNGVNEQKQLIYFVGDKGVSGSIRFDQIPTRPSVGEILELRYFEHSIEDKKNPGQTKKVIDFLKVSATQKTNTDLATSIYGELKVTYRYNLGSEIPDFGFVNDCYVHKDLLKKYRIRRDCFVEAKAIKQKDGRWKVVDITNIDNGNQ